MRTVWELHMLGKLFFTNKPRAMVTPSGSRASRLDFKSLL